MVGEWGNREKVITRRHGLDLKDKHSCRVRTRGTLADLKAQSKELGNVQGNDEICTRRLHLQQSEVIRFMIICISLIMSVYIYILSS